MNVDLEACRAVDVCIDQANGAVVLTLANGVEIGRLDRTMSLKLAADITEWRAPASLVNQ